MWWLCEIKISVLAGFVILLSVFGCENNAEKFRIKVEPNAIFVDGKEIAKTDAVAKQDTLLVKALDVVLRNKREAEIAEFKKTNKEPDAQSFVMLQFAPNISYEVLFKIMANVGVSGYTNLRLTSKINGKHYTESLYLPERGDFVGDNRLPCKNFSLLDKLMGVKPDRNENCLKLTLMINKEYFEIWANGNSLPKIPVVNPIDSTYSELKKALTPLRSRFINSPDVDEIIIVANGDMEISYIIQAMHIAGTVGFSKKNLSKLAGEVKLTKEESIRRHNEFIARERIIDSLFSLGLDTTSLAKLFIENKLVPVFGEDTSTSLNFAKVRIRAKMKADSIRKQYKSR